MRESIKRLLMSKGFWIWAIIWFSTWGLAHWTGNSWLYLIWIPALLVLSGYYIFNHWWICVCSNCGKEYYLEPDERYCSRCGSPTSIKRKIRKMKICPSGHKIEDEWNTYQRCPKCGGLLQLFESETSFQLSKEMEEQKRKEEKEREKIKKLIFETEELIEKIVLRVKNPEFLTVLKILGELELPQILQQFTDKEISYQEAEEKVLNLREQAKILSIVPSGEETYYQILGVSEEASQEELKSSFREKIMEYHPDRQSPESKQWVKKMAEEMTKKLNEAYAILGDSKKRKEYDQKIGIRR